MLLCSERGQSFTRRCFLSSLLEIWWMFLFGNHSLLIRASKSISVFSLLLSSVFDARRVMLWGLLLGWEILSSLIIFIQLWEPSLSLQCDWTPVGDLLPDLIRNWRLPMSKSILTVLMVLRESLRTFLLLLVNSLVQSFEQMVLKFLVIILSFIVTRFAVCISLWSVPNNWLLFVSWSNGLLWIRHLHKFIKSIIAQFGVINLR